MLMEDSEKTRFTVIDLHDLHDLEDQKTRGLEDQKTRRPKDLEATYCTITRYLWNNHINQKKYQIL